MHHICTWKTCAKAAVNHSRRVSLLCIHVWPDSIYTTHPHTVTARISLSARRTDPTLSHNAAVVTSINWAMRRSQILKIMLDFRTNPGEYLEQWQSERQRGWNAWDEGQVSVLKHWSYNHTICTSVCWNTTEADEAERRFEDFSENKKTTLVCLQFVVFRLKVWARHFTWWLMQSVVSPAPQKWLSTWDLLLYSSHGVLL